ncbi:MULTISPECIES: SdpI family protein [Peptoniphilus]|uniref:SdpI family protein n=1 Tax=Peptoniphilus TaxID=162289 RepID=UPI0001DA9AC4|nr:MULTISPECIES: SdpI family protein [Peptoniphilus]EFI42014.1 hypothetical protein HMPREF0629_00647 [Peptoniphilus sp. oral taxon 386 str. F0131]
MKFWIFMLIMNLLIPFSLIIIGYKYKKNPPMKINKFHGYRTSMSMKNNETWIFAQKYHGKLCSSLGIIMLPISIISMLFIIKKDINTVGKIGGIICLLQLIVLILSIIPTEKALKKSFDSNGNKKIQ